MATQAQEYSRGRLFPAPLNRNFHCRSACGGAHSFRRIRVQAGHPLDVGGLRQAAPQAGSEISGSAGQGLSHNFAQHCNPPFGDTTLDIQISQDINAPGWKGRAALCAAAQVSDNHSVSFKPEGNKPALKLNTGEQ